MNVTGTTCGSDDVSFSDHAESRVMLKTVHYKYDNVYPVVRSDTSNDIILNIGVKAYSNAHILFSPTNSPFERMTAYEIVLGVDHNKHCCIRRQRQGEPVTHVEYGNMVSGDEWRFFWLRVSSKGLIEIGNKENDLPFMMWQDTSPLTIKYFSFSSWENTVALWSWFFDYSSSDNKKIFDVSSGTDSKICELNNVSFSHCLEPTVMLKTTHYQYDNFYPVLRSPYKIWLNFRVKAYSNAHILFSPANSLYTGMDVYEIVLGANHNKYCSIRRQQLRETLTHVEFENMVSGDEFRSFWVHISSQGLIEIGNTGNDLPFMLYQDNNLLNIRYFSFSSWYNTAALWSWESEDRSDDEDFETLTGTESSFSDGD